MSGTRRVGREFESRAADYLLAKGFTLIGRRFTVKGGEIDLIALDGDTLVFIEVKGSRVPTLRAGESLNPVKRERMEFAASEFMKRMEIAGKPFRFDVITIDGAEIQHFESADWD